MIPRRPFSKTALDTGAALCHKGPSFSEVVSERPRPRGGRAMNRRQVLQFALIAPLAASLACKGSSDTRPYKEPPPPGLKPTTLQYADTEAFDALFETALTNQDPAILIKTNSRKPDWGGRLNAWIAAWNRGGKVEGEAGTVRGQAPAIVVDGDSIREFRLLVDDLMVRVEGLARVGSTWWMEERLRSKRVALLRPYNLRFHMDESGFIELIFFNGNYADSYPKFMEMLAASDDEGHAQWRRAVQCSHCKRRRSSGEPEPRTSAD